MIALILLACVRLAPIDPAVAVPTCSRLHYTRVAYTCADLFLCSRPDGASVRAWVQLRPLSRTIPAARIPYEGCDPQDPVCLDRAIERGIELACSASTVSRDSR